MNLKMTVYVPAMERLMPAVGISENMICVHANALFLFQGPPLVTWLNFNPSMNK